ncbi:ABC transporter substrate-binding protein [Cohnella sp. CFH 77786]|uniref:ABC transporter substrate-binding protein n=1 Tax=Cohnella sp. CFH 77786 TaxID=2662265 RepID=UPI001C60E5BD|nr:ABC transporter substrate-binding protein [Cohnella sp. CFH 77786]MBW5447173.1 ABC transporter substrate-binding protein [Cohnella sp. CFH 77786]
MKGKVAKISSVLIVSALLATTGCTNSSQTKPTTSDASTATADPKPDLTPMTVRLGTGGPFDPYWDEMQSDVGKVIKEKTGITLKKEFSVEGGDPQKYYSLMVASNEYPDLVSGGVSQLVNAGAVLDLAPLIDKYGPNIKKVYGDYMKRLRWSNTDHAIYALPWPGVNGTTFDAGGGFEIQHQVLKELGYPQIKTVKDYEAALKAYKDKHPTTADGKPTIGMSLNAGEWQIVISVTNPAFFTTGAPDDGEFFIDPKTYEAKLHYLRPEEKEYFRWLNHMNDIGLLDPESFTQKYDQYKAKIATGRVLGMIDQEWDYGEALNTLKKEGKFDQTYAHFPVTLNDTYKDHSFQDTGYMAGPGISITKSAKDPVRLIKFLDYLASDEGQVLINWGIEGVHYKVENGKRVIPADVLEKKNNDANNFKKSTGIGNYTLLSASYGDGVKDPSGNYYTTTFPELIQAKYSKADKETLAAYKASTYLDLWPKKEEFPVKPWGAAWTINLETGSEADVIKTKCLDIMKKRVPEAILAKPDQFDAIWDAFMKDLDKAGVQKLNQAYTQLVKDRIKLWNE